MVLPSAKAFGSFGILKNEINQLMLWTTAMYLNPEGKHNGIIETVNFMEDHSSLPQKLLIELSAFSIPQLLLKI